jgi:hypothetical protein
MSVADDLVGLRRSLPDSAAVPWGVAMLASVFDVVTTMAGLEADRDGDAARGRRPGLTRAGPARLFARAW